jgi:hypothetical protein
MAIFKKERQPQQPSASVACARKIYPASLIGNAPASVDSIWDAAQTAASRRNREKPGEMRKSTVAN